MKCVFCDSHEFGEYAGRPSAQCKGCGSLERSRIIALRLQQSQILRKGMRVLHFAPERCLHDLIMSYDPVEYVKADMRDVVEGIPVTRFDIPAQIHTLHDQSFDLIIHNHVLEHLRCSDTYVVYHIHRALVRGGTHVFSVPIWPGRHYKSDFGETNPEVLKANFGQEDHVALYGSIGFELGLGACLGIDSHYDLEEKVPRHLLDENHIPDKFRKGLSGSSVFLCKKEDWAFSL